MKKYIKKTFQGEWILYVLPLYINQIGKLMELIGKTTNHYHGWDKESTTSIPNRFSLG
jgi:hypothetical protein